jgi:serine/threonine-protein kinase
MAEYIQLKQVNIMKKFGHYEVTAELGRGGMGVVYAGWEPSLNRQVAIKCLGEHLLNDKDLVERFTREAKATAALNNPNVIQIYFIGEEQGQPFFAMEFIEGQSLDDILKGGNALSVKNAKNILKQACLGLTAAHAKELVHRDIKPANIMITTDGTLKIVDFGIARTREYGDKLTNTGEFVGTPGYLSPEVCIGQEVDERSDIFSLGIVFYEMLAGKVPFENDSPLGLMLEVVQSEIPDIRQLNTKVDKKTSFILNKMIAKSPDERYQTCAEIIRDLGNTVENQTIADIKDKAKHVKVTTASPKISNQITLPHAAAVTKNNLIVTQQTKSSKKWMIAATLFAVLGAASFGYYKGYLPVPGQADNSIVETKPPTLESMNTGNQPTTALVDGNLLTAGIADRDNKDAVAQPSTEGTGLMNGISNMFSGSESADMQGKAMIVTEPVNAQLTKTSTQGDKPTAQLNTVAMNTANSSNRLANQQSTIPTVMPETTATIAQEVQQKTIVPLNKGVVVIAFGDPAIANPVEKILESQLKQQGIKVMNEQFISGMRQVVNNGLDLAELKNLIQKNGGQAMVIANVNYVGSQQLQYAGRSSELINAQIDIDTYDIRSGDSIGSGFGTKISYTSLNATDQASDAVMQFADQLTRTLKNKI